MHAVVTRVVEGRVHWPPAPGYGLVRFFCMAFISSDMKSSPPAEPVCGVVLLGGAGGIFLTDPGTRGPGGAAAGGGGGGGGGGGAPAPT